MANEDIRKYESLPPETSQAVRMDLKNFKNLLTFQSPNKLPMFDLKPCENSKTKLIEIFGECSLIHLFCSNIIFTAKVSYIKNEDFEDEITKEIKLFENSKWQDTPFLETLYMFLCLNHLNKKSFSKAYDLSLKLIKSRQKLSESVYDTSLAGPFSYKFEALVGLKKYMSVINEFKEIPPSLLDDENHRHLVAITSIYKCVAISYFEIGKIEQACLYQEIALSKKYAALRHREHPLVQKEAILLQTYLAKKGDWAAVRTLEERYELKPLPKDAKEK